MTRGFQSRYSENCRRRPEVSFNGKGLVIIGSDAGAIVPLSRFRVSIPLLLMSMIPCPLIVPPVISILLKERRVPR